MEGGSAVLNYIRAELYKVARRPYARVMLLVLLALECLFLLIFTAEGRGRGEFAWLVGVLSTTMIVGIYLAILCADLVDADLSRGATLKNEVAFGLSRTRIYLGRLWAALVLALLMCAATFVFCLGAGWLLTAHSDPAAERDNLLILAYVAGASLPLWLATLSISHCVFLLTRSSVAAGIGLVAFFTWGGGFFWILGQFEPFGLVGLAFGFIAELVPTTPFGEYHDHMTWALMIRHWAVGLGWLAVSTGIGLARFRRQEL